MIFDIPDSLFYIRFTTWSSELIKHVLEKRIVKTFIHILDEELESFIIEIIDANNRGVSAIGNVSSEPNWSIGQSMFFAGTILTTIGMYHA